MSLFSIRAKSQILHAKPTVLLNLRIIPDLVAVFCVFSAKNAGLVACFSSDRHAKKLLFFRKTPTGPSFASVAEGVADFLKN